MSRRFLRGVRARLDRTEEHLADLRTYFKELRKDDPDASVEGDLVTGSATDVIGIELVKSRPSVLIGEIIYNLRAALDYLVYALARLDSGQFQEKTQFPINDTPDGFTTSKRRGFLNGVNAAHEARIEALQPYNGCHWTKLLASLSNPDKHRHLTRLLETGTFHYRRIDTSTRSIDEADRYSVRPSDVYMKVARTSEITFPDGTPIIDTLEHLKLQVAQTLEAFESDFDR